MGKFFLVVTITSIPFTFPFKNLAVVIRIKLLLKKLKTMYLVNEVI